MMFNGAAQTLLDDCKNELNQIASLISKMTLFDPQIKFLLKYSLILACGTIEQSYKTIIADAHSYFHPRIDNYINAQVRETSKNPSYDNIIKLLKDFDINWSKEFKNRINTNADKERLLASLRSLNNERHKFAHGLNSLPAPSLNDITKYYNDAYSIMIILDDVVNGPTHHTP